MKECVLSPGPLFHLGFPVTLPMQMTASASLFRPVEHVAVRGEVFRFSGEMLHTEPACHYQKQDRRPGDDVQERAPHDITPQALQSP